MHLFTTGVELQQVYNRCRSRTSSWLVEIGMPRLVKGCQSASMCWCAEW